MPDIHELEKIAMKNEGMPPELKGPQQYFYLAMRMLYRDFKAGYISHEQAKQEKNEVIEQYRLFDLWYQIAMNQHKIYKNPIFSQAHKTGCPKCREMACIMTGLKTEIIGGTENESNN